MNSNSTAAILAGVLASGLLAAGAGAFAQSSPASPAPNAAAAPASPVPSPAKPFAAHGVPISQRGQMWYAARYGVDHLQVRTISSGISLEFRYHVLDPDKAHILGDKNAKPYLTDWKSGRQLTVPTMEKIGQLRQQVSRLEAGREYWMVFANPGKLVKAGDKVDVVVGAIHLDGLIVE